MTTPLTCTQTGQQIGLVEQLSLSGEGAIWHTDRSGFLAKVYTAPTPQRLQKLEVMVANPPKEPNGHLTHTSFAWPTSLLVDQRGRGVGFLMPHITNSVELIEVYNPRRRQQRLPSFNWLYLHTTAMNLASIIWAIHEAGYVLGDIKPQNILVNNRALPAIIDTDSFQVRHPITGTLFHCLVGTESFTPPELLSQDLATVTQSEYHDRFRLALIIYLLLFGDHPFKGKWMGQGDSPEPNELVRRGFWPYGQHGLIQPGPLTIPLDVAHPLIKRAFLQCFNQGHTDPKQRPSAREWAVVLTTAIAQLTPCSRQKRHYYTATSGSCYWCQRKRTLGIDVFDLPASRSRPTSHRSRQPRGTQRTPAKVPQQARILRTPTASSAQNAGSSPSRLERWRASFTSVTQPLAQSSRGPQGQRFQIRSLWQRLLGPASRRPTVMVRSPSVRSKWLKLSGIVGGGIGLFIVSLIASRSHISADQMQLTVVGGLACLGLILLGAFWMRVLQNYDL